MNKWHILHEYMNLAVIGVLPWPACPECELDFSLVVGKEDTPAFRCYTCKIVFNIGLDVYDQMQRAIKEYSENSQ